MRIVCALAVVAFALAGCAPELDRAVALDGIEVRVHVADDDAERSQGLQGYDPLAEGEGMLFVFDDVAPRTFAMKDVSFPIDILFIDSDLNVSAIVALDPGDTELAQSPSPSPYVIELPQGWAEEQGVGVGSTLVMPE
jgi:hypothetical protein